MKIALLGLGGMGSVVRHVALERGHEVPVIVDPKANAMAMENSKFFQNLTPELLDGIDVVIDFSLAAAVLSNVRICAEAGKNIVVGTTGWYEKMEEVRRLVEGGERECEGKGVREEGEECESGKKEGDRERESKKGNNLPAVGCFWSSNFSIGVNLYFRIIEDAAKMMNQFDEYDVWGHEIHHFNKADSPSGTAKILGDILTKNIERKTSVVTERLDRKRAPEEIHFSSLRGGAVNFGHTIGFDSAADRILITHEARNRDGYALGAVKAAEWLKGRKGFFGMKDFLGF